MCSLEPGLWHEAGETRDLCTIFLLQSRGVNRPVSLRICPRFYHYICNNWCNEKDRVPKLWNHKSIHINRRSLNANMMLWQDGIFMGKVLKSESVLHIVLILESPVSKLHLRPLHHVISSLPLSRGHAHSPVQPADVSFTSFYFLRPSVPSGSDLGLRQCHADPQHGHRSGGRCGWRSGKKTGFWMYFI